MSRSFSATPLLRVAGRLSWPEQSIEVTWIRLPRCIIAIATVSTERELLSRRITVAATT